MFLFLVIFWQFNKATLLSSAWQFQLVVHGNFTSCWMATSLCSAWQLFLAVTLTWQLKFLSTWQFSISPAWQPYYQTDGKLYLVFFNMATSFTFIMAFLFCLFNMAIFLAHSYMPFFIFTLTWKLVRRLPHGNFS